MIFDILFNTLFAPLIRHPFTGKRIWHHLYKGAYGARLNPYNDVTPMLQSVKYWLSPAR